QCGRKPHQECTDVRFKVPNSGGTSRYDIDVTMALWALHLTAVQAYGCAHRPAGVKIEHMIGVRGGLNASRRDIDPNQFKQLWRTARWVHRKSSERASSVSIAFTYSLAVFQFHGES